MQYAEFLFEALKSELGVVVQSSDPIRFRNKLYETKRQDDQFACLSFFVSPIKPETDLWIVKIDGEI